MTTTKKRTRAPNGTDETRFILRLPRELRRGAKQAAKAEGITESEWWRRAGRDRALRQSAQKREA